MCMIHYKVTLHLQISPTVSPTVSPVDKPWSSSLLLHRPILKKYPKSYEFPTRLQTRSQLWHTWTSYFDNNCQFNGLYVIFEKQPTATSRLDSANRTRNQQYRDTIKKACQKKCKIEINRMTHHCNHSSIEEHWIKHCFHCSSFHWDPQQALLKHKSPCVDHQPRSCHIFRWNSKWLALRGNTIDMHSWGFSFKLDAKDRVSKWCYLEICGNSLHHRPCILELASHTKQVHA